MKNNIVAAKSYAFAIRIVYLYKHLSQTLKEYVHSKQMLRSGNAIGALIRETELAQSMPYFKGKNLMPQALKNGKSVINEDLKGFDKENLKLLHAMLNSIYTDIEKK